MLIACCPVNPGPIAVLDIHKGSQRKIMKTSLSVVQEKLLVTPSFLWLGNDRSHSICAMTGLLFLVLPSPCCPLSSCLPSLHSSRMALMYVHSSVSICRYNKPLLPKYEAAERRVEEKQHEIEAKIAGRRINQVCHAFCASVVCHQTTPVCLHQRNCMYVSCMCEPA